MYLNYPVLSKLGVILLDTVMIIASYVLAIKVRVWLGLSNPMGWEIYLNLLLIILIVWRGISAYHEAYAGQSSTLLNHPGRVTSLNEDLMIIVKTVFYGSIVLFLIRFLIPWSFPKSLIVFYAIISFILLSTEKIILHKVMGYLLRHKGSTKKVIIIGTGTVAEKIINSINKHSDWRIRIVGLICEEQCSNVGKKIFGYKILGHIGEFAKVLHSVYIDELIIAITSKYLSHAEQVLARCDKEGVPVKLISPFFENVISKSIPEVIHDFPVIHFSPVVRNDFEMMVKRMIDIFVSLLALIFLTPLFVIIAIIVKTDSPGPVLYQWKILGLNKKPLVSYKFRTMIQNADAMKDKLALHNEMGGAAFKIKNDPRITAAGKWLRKYSLDELPQLWSVFRGDLSLVGPRPPLQTEVEQYEGWHRRKLSVKPGITCLWQISGRNVISNFDEWMQLDLKYIDEWSLWLDIKILIKTVPAIIKGTGL